MIKTIEFSDGTVWTGTDIARMVQEQGVHGTETDDTISDLSNWYAYDNDATFTEIQETILFMVMKEMMSFLEM